jgi:aryl-alcohol dehydrogenase-like predicted oxidoreductase
LAALHRAIDLGVNFVDTADVYGDGRSERLIGRLLKERSERIYVATKAGRRLNSHVAEGYTRENLTAFVERSLRNLDVEALDLLQLHCPPRPVYDRPAVFAALDDLVQAALDAGAFAARMTGGGFGGSVVALSEPARARAVLGTAPAGWIVRPVDGAIRRRTGLTRDRA